MSWRIKESEVEILVVDVQQKLLPAMFQADLVERHLSQLISAAVILGIPVSFTEQNPTGLGKTVDSLKSLAPGAAVYEKTRFSAGEFGVNLERKKIIVVGLEAHICVRQTVYDLIRQSKTVVVVADAVASRFQENKTVALAEFATDKVFLTTVEALLFELIGDSKHPLFKDIAALVK
jgi:nicotinamidase-related amidase